MPDRLLINRNLGIPSKVRVSDQPSDWKFACRRSHKSQISTEAVDCNSYTALGRDDEARVAALEVLRIDPKFSAQRYARMLPYKDPAINVRVLERLRKAGLPE